MRYIFAKNKVLITLVFCATDVDNKETQIYPVRTCHKGSDFEPLDSEQYFLKIDRQRNPLSLSRHN